MKIVLILMMAASALFSFKMNDNAQPRYVDLNTGMPFNLVKNAHTGLMVDDETGKPLNIYIDTQKGDTIFGRTGEVINGRVLKISKNNFAFVEGDVKTNQQVTKATVR